MTKNKKADFNERVFGDANERFVGDVLNEEKMKTLTKLRAVCREISEREPRIKYTAQPFSNRSENAFVALDFPKVLFCADAAVLNRISEACAIATDICTSTLTGGLRITFGINDMWTEFHYLEKK